MNTDLSFLWFKQSKELAWAQAISPAVNMFYRTQIQLLPFNPKPYVQLTQSQTNIGIESDSFDAFLVDCNGQEVNINDHVDILNFTDSENVGQIMITLKYLPLDYGSNLVMLKLRATGGAGEEIELYSNPFLLTNSKKELTTRVDYVVQREQALSPNYASIQLQMYKNNYVSGTQLETYYQITEGQNVISRVNKDRRLQWVFPNADPWHWIRLEEALYNSPCYMDFIRNYPAEAMNLDERLGDTSWSESFFVTDPDERDVINIPNVVVDPNVDYVPMLASTDVLASTDQIVSEIETPVTP